MAKKENKFEVVWQAEDGYAGGARPHRFRISTDDFEPDDSDGQLRALFGEMLQGEFEEHVRPSSEDEERFVEWARARQAEMRAAEE